MFKGVKGRLVAGLVVVLPIMATVVITWFFVKLLAGWTVGLFKLFPFLERLPSFLLTLLGLALMILVVYLVGLATSSYVGRGFIELVERAVSRLPLASSVYRATRQVVDNVLVKERDNLKRVVLVQFPHRGSWALGFITTSKKWKINGREHLNVYVPTTPNPTSGWYLIVPEDEVVEIPIEVDRGLEIVMSGGIVWEEEFPSVRVSEGSE